MAEIQYVKLQSCDEQIIVVEKEVALMSKCIENAMGTCDVDENTVVPVGEKIDAVTLAKIMDWCKAHKGEVHKPKEDHEDQRIDLTPEDIEYMAVDDDFLVKIIEGADFLEIQGIIDIITQKMALMIKGKSPEEIRVIFNLDDDLTDEEQEEIRKKYEWVEA